MSQKLLTIEELSEELGIKEKKIEDLVEKKVIFAYRIGGELLRFRKEQIDAQREEIYSHCSPSDYVELNRENPIITNKFDGSKFPDDLKDRIKDFLNFYDFYIITVLIALALLIYIFKG